MESKHTHKRMKRHLQDISHFICLNVGINRERKFKIVTSEKKKEWIADDSKWKIFIFRNANEKCAIFFVMIIIIMIKKRGFEEARMLYMFPELSKMRAWRKMWNCCMRKKDSLLRCNFECKYTDEPVHLLNLF